MNRNKGIILTAMIFLLVQTLNGYDKEPATLPPHRVLGYSILISGTLAASLGYINLTQYYDKGNAPPDILRWTHRALGYTTVTAAVTTATLGYINYFKLFHEKRGLFKRTVHMLLSTLATAGYVYAGVVAYRAGTRGEIDRYKTHRNIALLSLGSTILTIGWIIW